MAKTLLLPLPAPGHINLTLPIARELVERGKAKVFGIGLSRTGTTSLTNALQLVGYKTVHFPHDPVTRAEVYRFLACRPASVSLALLQDADALTDIPACCLYQAVDRAYPGSKFILTVREKQAWLRSCKHFWQRNVEPAARVAPGGPIVQYMRVMDTHLYGSLEFEEEGFSRAYDRFTGGVREYFRDRPGDLLILDICGGQGWNELAPFLGLAIPQMPFPWENREQNIVAQESGKDERSDATRWQPQEV